MLEGRKVWKVEAIKAPVNVPEAHTVSGHIDALDKLLHGVVRSRNLKGLASPASGGFRRSGWRTARGHRDRRATLSTDY